MLYNNSERWGEYAGILENVDWITINNIVYMYTNSALL